MTDAIKKKCRKKKSGLSKEVKEYSQSGDNGTYGKSIEEWKLSRETDPECDEVERAYQELLKTLTPEQEEVITKYCNAIFNSGAETEEFFYRLGLKDGHRLKDTVNSVVELLT